jgi:hypothetical protein
LAFFLFVIFATGMAQASTWCGKNGVVRLSFTADDSVVAITSVEPDTTGKVVVNVYAVLDRLEPVAHQGERFMGLEGFELGLIVEGAPATILPPELPSRAFNVERDPARVQAGLVKSISLRRGRATLLHWPVVFFEPPRNVVFRLDAKALPSCKTLTGCPESESYLLYAGTRASYQVNHLFGAGYTPAYLNWEGEPDLTPVSAESTWRQVGVYQEAAATKSNE